MSNEQPWGKGTAQPEQIYKIFYSNEPVSAIFLIKKPGIICRAKPVAGKYRNG